MLTPTFVIPEIMARFEQGMGLAFHVRLRERDTAAACLGHHAGKRDFGLVEFIHVRPYEGEIAADRTTWYRAHSGAAALKNMSYGAGQDEVVAGARMCEDTLRKRIAAEGPLMPARSRPRRLAKKVAKRLGSQPWLLAMLGSHPAQG
jgi:hypothetical protein